jgi:hypothetical protein
MTRYQHRFFMLIPLPPLACLQYAKPEVLNLLRTTNWILCAFWEKWHIMRFKQWKGTSNKDHYKWSTAYEFLKVCQVLQFNSTNKRPSRGWVRRDCTDKWMLESAQGLHYLLLVRVRSVLVRVFVCAVECSAEQQCKLPSNAILWKCICWNWLRVKE